MDEIKKKAASKSGNINPDTKQRIILAVITVILTAVFAILSVVLYDGYYDPYIDPGNGRVISQTLYPGSNSVRLTTSETYFSFTPSSSGTYTIYSTGSYDTYATLYSSDWSSLAYNDDGGNNNNFSISNYLTSGRTYYLAVKLYNGYSSTVSIYIGY